MSPSGGGKAILIDVGGVLVPSILSAAAADWGGRLGLPPAAFLAALFGGSDDQVLTGRPRCSSTTRLATWPRPRRSA